MMVKENDYFTFLEFFPKSDYIHINASLFKKHLNCTYLTTLEKQIFNNL